MSEHKVFCGVSRRTPGNALMEFVMGKAVDCDNDVSLHSEFSNGGEILLLEPVIVQRVPGMWQDPKTGQQQMVVTHQFIEDPYWPLHRGAEMPFRLDDFRTVRLMQSDLPRDVEEIRKYESFLTEYFAKSKGLVLPHQRK